MSITTDTLTFAPAVETKPRKRWFARLMAAMNESREREAMRVIHRYRHLLPDAAKAKETDQDAR